MQETQKKIQVRGSIATLAADNLGAHDIGGFRKCFSSGRICRFCMCNYEDIKSKFKEEDFQPRTPHVHDLQVLDVLYDGSLASVYGTVKSCPLASICGFSAVTSLPPDIMHDCLEGVIPIPMIQAIFRYLHLNNVTTYATVNNKIRQFEFGNMDAKNRPRCLPLDVVHAGGKIHLNASENWCLFRYFPFFC